MKIAAVVSAWVILVVLIGTATANARPLPDPKTYHPAGHLYVN